MPTFSLAKGGAEAGRLADPPGPDPADRVTGVIFSRVPERTDRGPSTSTNMFFRNFLEFFGSRARAAPSLPWAGPFSATLREKVSRTAKIRVFLKNADFVLGSTNKNPEKRVS